MNYKFSEIVDIQAVQRLMENLWKASGIPTGIIDIDGTVHVATGWQDICTRFHRQHPETARRCRESDAYISDHIGQQEGVFDGQPIEYQCRNGMVDIGVPIVIEGQHLATVFLGQFFYKPPDVAFFRRQARQFGFDEEAYLAALGAVPIFTRQKVRDILDFNAGMVNLFIRLGVEKLEQLEARRKLQESEQRFRALFENSNDAAYILEPGGPILAVNQAACEQFGYSRQELLQMSLPDLLSPDRAENFTNRVRQIEASGRLIFETVHRRRDGSYFPVEVSVRPFVDLGKSALIGTFRDISDRKRVVEKLRESKRRLATLMDNLPGMAYRCRNDQDWTMEFMSQGVTELTGYAPEELTVNGIMSYNQVIHTLDRQQVRDEVQKGLTEGRPFQLEYRIQTRSGEERWVWEQGQGIYGADGELLALEGLVTDITERKQTEGALKKALLVAEDAREKIDSILKSVAGGLFVTDRENRVMMINRLAQVWLGLQPQEAIGRPVETLLPSEAFCRQLHETIGGGAEGGSVEFELTNPRSGQVRVVKARTTKVRGEQGKLSGTITTLHDVTRDRELDRMKTEFISTAAHELRTPLTSVLGFSELLLNAGDIGLDEQQKSDYLRHIFNKANSLKQIADDLLDLGRVQSGQVISLAPAEFDLCSLVGQVVAQYELETGRRFEVAMPEAASELVGDRRKIEQVLENIISNAVKFSPAESRVRISAEVIEERLEVCVADQGDGMTAEQLTRIFDKFYRADASNTALGGLGLGMSIVKTIIEAHHGHIWVESEPGEGTRVTFALPLPERCSLAQGGV